MPSLLPARYQRPELATDEAYQETEEVLSDMIAELESIYSQAYNELSDVAKRFFADYIEAEKKKREQLQKGKITKEDYRTWRRNQYMTGRQTYALMETMSDNLTNRNTIAASIINSYLPEVYAINGNYTTYQIENHFGINTIFTMYDEQTVARLIREQPDLLPRARIDIPKDKQWNKKLLNSAMIQGIMQGDDVYTLANRLAAVTDMNRTSAIRNAATMTTAAQNGGRMDGYKRAKAMGVKGLKHEWIATLDGHTRESHIDVDGEVREIGQKFSNGLTYPGEPGGAPAEVYNCRCTTGAYFDDKEFKRADADDISGRNQHIYEKDSKVRNMTYTEWKNAHGDESLSRSARNVNRDMDMHEEYRDLLGNEVPTRFKDFQEIKYGEPALWAELIKKARKARNKRRNSQP